MKKVKFVSKDFFIVAGSLAALFLASCGAEGPTGVSSVASASHNAGSNCKECHSMAYSGTVVSSASSSTPVSGVKITIVEAGGGSVTMVSDKSGNFYSSSGSPSAGYTATLEGNRTQMTQHPAQGGCNSSGCHDGRSTPRVYVN